MKILRLGLLVISAALLAGCDTSNQPYHLHSHAENREWSDDTLDVYPNDVRQDPEKYDHARVAWAGVIKSSDAEEYGDGLIKIRAVFQHHYFDWEEDQIDGRLRYGLSPRGEGLFETDVVVRKVDPEADAAKAEEFASPGKMVIIYGTPERVDDDGVVHLKYRFAQVIDKKNYSTKVFDYGRFGEPVTYLQ